MRRTQLYRVMPWVGGINTSVDPGVLPAQELVQADNVQFSTTGARIKRNALEYLEPGPGGPDDRASSGTTRTLYWLTIPLISTRTPDQRLVLGEKITVTGDSNYATISAPITAVNTFAQVTAVTCIGDTAGSLAGKYFEVSAGDLGVDYYVWYKVSGSGTDPSLPGFTGIEVDITTGASANTVASATAAAIALNADFTTVAASAVVTITVTSKGTSNSASIGTSGFSISTTTRGGASIQYTASSSFSESRTSSGSVQVARASSVIMVDDYWHFNGTENAQLLVYATADFQLFSLSDSGRRVQIAGQEQTSTVVCGAASTITNGHHFYLNSSNDATEYYVWYDKGGAVDPAVGGKTGIHVVIGGSDTATQVATATAAAIDALADFVSTSSIATVTITNASAGVTTETQDVNTGFTFSTTKYGATAPVAAVDTIRTNKINERLQIYFSGIGNFPIIYNPEEDAKYQLMGENPSTGLTMPDASFAFNFLGRVWSNDKNNPDYLPFSAPFDEYSWFGIGDSSVLPVNPGDGDPRGVTNAFTYKEMVVVAKGDVRYRVIGDSPEVFQVQKISDGLGNEGALAIPVDETDVLFISRRGIHSQAVTDAYGDVMSSYLSSDIKPTFHTFVPTNLHKTQGAYIPELNSAAFSITEQGKSSPQDIWLYNFAVQVPNKQKPGAWYRWPGISCTALARQLTSGVHKLLIGTADGRVIRAQKTNSFADFDAYGIQFKIKTGAIYPGDDPQGMKAFKRITMLYRPKGNFSFNVQAKIDNHQSQGFSFTQSTGTDLLGSTFVLGTSILGISNVLAPFTFTMEGYGRGIELTITQPTADEQIEIWGFTVEYESVQLEQEVQ